MFQLYLDEFANQDPLEYKIVVLDNGSFHKAKRLKIPDNISLIFLPPYSPELNPAEKVWWVIKDKMKCKTYLNLKELRKDLMRILKEEINSDAIQQLCSFEYLMTFID
jgi:transposase